MRILTKNMRNVYVEAHRRAMKEYYPPHLTGPGSRGVGLLDMVFFGLGECVVHDDVVLLQSRSMSFLRSYFSE